MIHPELSYLVTGICFAVHNQLGRYGKEKQYCDLLEKRLQEIKLPFQRELQVSDSGNIIDFLIDKRIILEIKAKKFITKDDYYQTQRYLQILNVKLGLIINFHNRYLKPIRVVRIDTDVRKKYFHS